MTFTGNDIYTHEEQLFLQKLDKPVEHRVFQYKLNQGLSLLDLVQSHVSGPLLRDKDKTQEYMRTYCLALFVELGEFVNELAWKPWKPDKKVDTAKVKDEFADMLAFLGVILVLLKQLHPELTTTALATAYLHKSRLNIARFIGTVEGYSGVEHGQ